VRGNVREKTATIVILIPIAVRKMIVIVRAVAAHGTTRLKPRAGMTTVNGTRAIVDTVMPMRTKSVGVRSRRCQPRIARIERTAYAKSDRSAIVSDLILLARSSRHCVSSRAFKRRIAKCSFVSLLGLGTFISQPERF